MIHQRRRVQLVNVLRSNPVQLSGDHRRIVMGEIGTCDQKDVLALEHLCERFGKRQAGVPGLMPDNKGEHKKIPEGKLQEWQLNLDRMLLTVACISRAQYPSRRENLSTERRVD